MAEDNAFRGSYPAHIDEKSRLKVPQAYRARLESRGRDVFVTSFDRTYVRIYPMTVWQDIERQLASAGRSTEVAMFLHVANGNGQATEIDNQGRILIPQMLRQAAAMSGEVVLIGLYDYFTVWNKERADQRNTLSEELEQRVYTATGITSGQPR